MTRKDFIFIADVIRHMPTHAATLRAQQASVAAAFAERLGETNPRFDRDRFVEAATGAIELGALERLSVGEDDPKPVTPQVEALKGMTPLGLPESNSMKKLRALDLDVAAPDQVPNVLRAASARFEGDASELDSAHQTRSAGRPWRKIARVLDAAADRIAKFV